MTPKNANRRVRRLASAVAVVGVLDGSPALAQDAKTAEVWAQYQGLDPKGTYSFKLDDQPYTKSVGALRWDVPMDRLSAGGLDRNFTAYCAEPLIGVSAGTTYRFDIQMPEDPVAYGLPNTPAGIAEAKLRGTYIRELFGRHYLNSVNAQTPDNARAFQAALWELAFEKELPTPPAAAVGAPADPAPAPVAGKRFSLGTGTFRSDYTPPAEAPPFVATAEGYLQSLTGNDKPFAENLAGYELVRMNGLPNATGIVAQDQYALRTKAAAAAGASGPGGSLVGGSGVGGGLGGTSGGIGGTGFGAPVGGGGSGGGIGGGSGGGFSVVPPTSTIASPPVSPPQTVSPPPFSPPPINSPPPPPPQTSVPPPPDVPPTTTSPPPPPVDPPTNPVPAPAGLLLGGIAALALAGRRALTRGNAKK